MGERVGKRELKTRWSKYFKRVERGETICVTDRGRVAFYLVPPDRLPPELRGEDERREEAIQRLLQAGLGTWGGGRIDPRVQRVPLRARVPSVTDLLLEDRREGP